MMSEWVLSTLTWSYFFIYYILQRVSRMDSRYFTAAQPPPIEDEDDGGIYRILQTVSA